MLVRLLSIVVLAVGVDLVTKAAAEKALLIYRPVEVMGEWFRFTLTYNKGVAFGLFATDGPGVIIVSGLAILLLGVLLIYGLRSGHYKSWTVWAIGVLLGGAVANFIDRMADGRVTDFLDFGLGMHRFATFNFADVFIVVGVGLLLLGSHRHDPEEASFTKPVQAGRPGDNGSK